MLERRFSVLVEEVLVAEILNEKTEDLSVDIVGAFQGVLLDAIAGAGVEAASC